MSSAYTDFAAYSKYAEYSGHAACCKCSDYFDFSKYSEFSEYSGYSESISNTPSGGFQVCRVFQIHRASSYFAYSMYFGYSVSSELKIRGVSCASITSNSRIQSSQGGPKTGGIACISKTPPNTLATLRTSVLNHSQLLNGIQNVSKFTR